ncbi:hypothetical protein DTO027B5_1800 [Paecilomyces variotii]|nr:hypothetical protein DTO027B3_1342 [Paecilomyces variotii]KAJ9336485.1 hypothetical protein DTO027B5_1800 [Paecilomyces variotii]
MMCVLLPAYSNPHLIRSRSTPVALKRQSEEVRVLSLAISTTELSVDSMEISHSQPSRRAYALLHTITDMLQRRRSYPVLSGVLVLDRCSPVPRVRTFPLRVI